MELNFRTLETRQPRAELVLDYSCYAMKKKEHLFQMEIQGLCWDKRALPRCGRDRMQGNNLVRLLFMETYTTCVSSEWQHIHHVHIKVRAELNKCHI